MSAVRERGDGSHKREQQKMWKGLGAFNMVRTARGQEQNAKRLILNIAFFQIVASILGRLDINNFCDSFAQLLYLRDSCRSAIQS